MKNFINSFVVIIIILLIYPDNLLSQKKNWKETMEDLENEMEDKITLRFFNAINGKPISDADITIEGIIKGKTDFEGKILFDIPDDKTYLINFSHPKYITSILKLEVIVGTIFNNRFSISPMLPIGSLRVVLDWGNKPNDLDAHLVKQSDYHISFRNMKTSRDNSAMLDRDDLDGFGPETITVKNINNNSEYKYFIHNYTNKDASETKDLSNSKARILVFGDNRLIQQIEISKNITGKFWNVFKIVNGQIILVNEVDNIGKLN